MPAAVWFGSGSQIKDSIKYKYDSCGNICQITENGSIATKYTYDSLNRLIREDNKALGKTILFTYDNAGNITERCEYAYTAKSGEELSELKCTRYSYDYNGDRLVSYNGGNFAYNMQGCPLLYRGRTMTWLYSKYLASYNGVSFTYNGNGSRAKKGSITFTYDNDGRLVKQSNGLEFFYDNTGVAGVSYDGEQYFYRKDAQGNIIAILDSSSVVVVRYVYDAWGNHKALDSDGNTVTSGIGLLNPFRYRGYYYDTETKLYYLQTRYYDLEVGRFISQDSIEYAEHEAINGLNLYAYCGNNPVMGYDPTGTMAELSFTFLGGFLTQFVVSAYSYLGIAVASIFDKEIRQDMNDIGWNPFNSDESTVVKSRKVSFFKGVPVIRHNIKKGSMTLGAIFLYKYSSDDEERAIKVVNHERGHSTQLMWMGLGNYLIQIGIPSLWKNDDYAPWELSASINGGSALGNSASTQQFDAAKTYFVLACIPIVNICNIIWYLLYK